MDLQSAREKEEAERNARNAEHDKRLQEIWKTGGSPEAVAITRGGPKRVERPKNKCASCGEEIDRGSDMKFQGKYYHADHMQCVECGVGLAGRPYVRRGEMVCEKHAGAATDEERVCHRCGKPITDSVMKAKGNMYHTACFTCSHKGCGDHLGGGYLTTPEGELVCRDHMPKKPKRKKSAKKSKKSDDPDAKDDDDDDGDAPKPKPKPQVICVVS